MTAIHLDIIHGDHLVQSPVARSVDAAQLGDPLALAAASDADNVRLAWVRNRPAYLLSTNRGERLLDAVSGRPVAPLSEAEIRALAKTTYAGTEPVASAVLISEIPGEIRGRRPPLWRVEFDHWNKPTLYFSPTTGELVARRHELWRIFDFVWMFHIMYFDQRENVNNPLLRVFTWAALLMASSGIWLLFTPSTGRRKKHAHDGQIHLAPAHP